MSQPPSARGARSHDPKTIRTARARTSDENKTCSSSCLSWLHLLKSWSLRQSRDGSHRRCIEVAQFIYLLLHNDKIREVIDTVTAKAVLILGRFTDERKAVLDALRDELRKRDCLPILFDFEKPRSRDTDETITLLAPDQWFESEGTSHRHCPIPQSRLAVWSAHHDSTRWQLGPDTGEAAAREDLSATRPREKPP